MKRINEIDIARGLAIILIVFGHTINHSIHCNIVFKILYSFHVALFFIISGYICNTKKNYLIFVKNKICRLLIPYFVWSILFLIPYFLFGTNVAKNINVISSFNIKELIMNILYGNGNLNALKQNSSLWFLPALFSMELIYYWIVKLSESWRTTIKIMLMAFLILISIVSNCYIKFVMPFGINTVLTMGTYYYLGYLLKKENIIHFLSNKYYIIPLLLIGIVFSIINDGVQPIDYQYGNISLSLISGMSLSLLVLLVSFAIKNNKYLIYVGKNTMSILIFHKLIILIFQTKLSILTNLLINNNIIIELLLSIIILIISILVSLGIGFIINRICPLLLGNKKVA